MSASVKRKCPRLLKFSARAIPVSIFPTPVLLFTILGGVSNIKTFNKRTVFNDCVNERNIKFDTSVFDAEKMWLNVENMAIAEYLYL